MQRTRTEWLSRWLHHCMSAVGGVFAGYAVVVRGVLGNAQTLNLIELVLKALEHKGWLVFLHLIALALYFGAAFLFAVLAAHQAPTRWICLGINTVAMLIEALLPASCPVTVALYAIFFAMSFQWNAFASATGYTSSTIFSTNNTRQVALALGDYCCKKDRMQLDKAAFFAGSLLFFHIGVASAALSARALGVRAIIAVIPFLLFAAGMLHRVEKLEASA